MATRDQRISETLISAFAPVALEITDESAKHAGHAGRNGLEAGETHYLIVMVAAAFEGKSRLARSRAVHEALAPEFKTGLHAISLSLRTPAEMENL